MNQSPHPLFIRYSFIEYTVYARLCVCVSLCVCESMPTEKPTQFIRLLKL